MSRTYVIADMHGRFDLLRDTLNVIEQHAGDRGGTLICLGDMVDRGPDSRSIIELLKLGAAETGWRWIVLKGNHEDMMVRCVRGQAPLGWWVGNGGGRTLMSYGYRNGDALSAEDQPIGGHLEWIDGLPLMHLDQHRVYVHAGVTQGASLEEQSPQMMMWMLYDEDDPSGHGDRHVVHGHHQFAHGPRLFSGRSNLDTYAWKTGRLAIGVFDDDTPGGPVDVLWAVGEPTF